LSLSVGGQYTVHANTAALRGSPLFATGGRLIAKCGVAPMCLPIILYSGRYLSNAIPTQAVGSAPVVLINLRDVSQPKIVNVVSRLSPLILLQVMLINCSPVMDMHVASQDEFNQANKPGSCT